MHVYLITLVMSLEPKRCFMLSSFITYQSLIFLFLWSPFFLPEGRTSSHLTLVSLLYESGKNLQLRRQVPERILECQSSGNHPSVVLAIFIRSFSWWAYWCSLVGFIAKNFWMTLGGHALHRGCWSSLLQGFPMCKSNVSNGMLIWCPGLCYTAWQHYATLSITECQSYMHWPLPIVHTDNNFSGILFHVVEFYFWICRFLWAFSNWTLLLRNIGLVNANIMAISSNELYHICAKWVKETSCCWPWSSRLCMQSRTEWD